MAATGVFGLTRFTALASGDVIPAVDISDSTQSAHGSLDAMTVVNFFATIPVPVIVTSASANALAVGLAGSSNSAFLVDCSTALQVAGLKVTGAVTGGTVAVVVTDSGLNASLTVNAKGSGTIGIGTVSTGRVTITPVTTITGALTLSAALTYGGVTLSNAVTGTGNMVLSASPTFTGTITAAIANFSGAVSTAGLTCTTLAGTGAVSGFTTAAFSGTVTTTIAGMTNSVKLAQVSDATTYGTVSLNGVLTAAGLVGIFGGASGDDSAYVQGGATSGVRLRVAGTSRVIVLDATCTISSTTTAVQALTATSVAVSAGSAGQGQMWYAAASGLMLQAKTGSVTDFQINNPGNSGSYMTVATGTLNLTFGGSGAFAAGISCTTGTFSGGAKTASGATSVPSATATTLFAPSAKGMYLVYGVATDATCWASVSVQTDESGSILSISAIGSGGSGAINNASGNNVTFNQSTGLTKTVNWRYLRID